MTWFRFNQSGPALLAVTFGAALAFAVENGVPASASTAAALISGVMFLAFVWRVACSAPR